MLRKLEEEFYGNVYEDTLRGSLAGLMKPDELDRTTELMWKGGMLHHSTGGRINLAKG